MVDEDSFAEKWSFQPISEGFYAIIPARFHSGLAA